jgi:hypothetical protein
MRQQPRPTPVYLEVGQKKTFACALDWPGWARPGKTEEAALEALAEYHPRYAVVAKEAGVAFPARLANAFDVLERVPGNATTDFGAPGLVPALAGEALPPRRAKRNAVLVEAAWTVLDRVAAGAPAQLRKGPRGGGRDRDKVVAHVIAAEASYARSIGVRHKAPEPTDTGTVAALRADILAALRSASGEPPAQWRWPPRYAAMRIAWHVLDHAWEIEDKSG